MTKLSTGNLLLRDELQEHGERVRVHETHRDVDVLDPQFVQRQLHRLAVHADVGDTAARSNDLRRHGERLRNAHRFDRNVDALAVSECEDLLFPVRVTGVDGIRGAEIARTLQSRLSSRSIAMICEGP